MPKAPVGVATDGVYVTLTLGGRSVSLTYDVANRLAVLLRGHARKAKANAGDTTVRVIGFADLTDAALDELKAQRNRDSGTAFLR